MFKRNKGFTLVELMVVMALIAVLSTLIIGAIRLATNTAKETTHRSNAKSIQTALESQYAKYRRYCGVAGGGYPSCPVAGSRLSFQAVASEYDIELSDGSSANESCASGGGTEGGGRVWITASSYVIKPADAACTAYTSFQDLLQVGLSTALTAATWNNSPYGW